MASSDYPAHMRLPATVKTAASATQRPANILERGAVFLVGGLLPAIAISPWGSSNWAGILQRATMVDFMVITALAALVVGRTGIRLNLAATVYIGALVLAATIGLIRATGPDDLGHVITATIALSMAMLYWVLGASIARSRELVSALMLGLCCGVLAESVVVFHDLFAAVPWFPDDDIRRLRGTFRMNGQLAAYGFSTAGLLLCFGFPLARHNRGRMLILLSAALAVFFVFGASRRSGIAAVLLWLAMFLLLGMRRSLKRIYPLVVVGALLASVGVAWYWQSISDTFAGQRVTDALEDVTAGQSTFQVQFMSAMNDLDEWFPLGTGLGRGYTVARLNPHETYFLEVHNGHLALLVEAGLLGLMAFYWLLGQAAFRRWNGDFGRHTKLAQVLLLTFIIAASAFMIHNRLHRDRGFLLLLGIASSAAFAQTVAHPKLLLAIRRRGTPRR